MKNPFRILGFSPEFIRSLRREQLEVVIAGQYRSLSRLFHPDHVGDDKKANARLQEVSWAWEEIGRGCDINNQAFWKQDFMKTKRQQMDDLEDAVSFQETTYAKLAVAFQTFLLEWAFPEVETGRSINNLLPTWCMMSDLLDNHLHNRDFRNPFETKRTVFDVFVIDHSTIFRREVRRQYCREEQPPTDLPTEWQHTSNLKHMSYWLKPAGPLEALPGLTIVGSFDPTELRVRDEALHRKMFPRRIGQAEREELQEGLDWGLFVEFLPYMKPVLEEHCNVVCVTDRGKVKMLGRILNIADQELPDEVMCDKRAFPV
jgi:hypothetical protein